MGKFGMMPSHPGAFIRRQVLEPLDLSISQAAKILSIRRATLSNLVNEKSGLSPEMALRLEKAFDIRMDFLLRMQALYDTERMRQTRKKIDVVRFQPQP
ncbi:MAG: addiction module antidote protein, HigA family [Nitrospinae bacterium CG11_big_fil_rev_8_21_14_0_20_56_8]|nr:MAG: addiction module antidote protein, HigA family [Nitrospinae bacterium CG11_big_fil_rev_8_21_14_0_20_56_8]